jgi:hypothetical protein
MTVRAIAGYVEHQRLSTGRHSRLRPDVLPSVEAAHAREHVIAAQVEEQGRIASDTARRACDQD